MLSKPNIERQICVISRTCGIFKNRVEQWLPEAGRWRKRKDTDQRVKSFRYKMNKFCTPNVSYVTANNNALHTYNLLSRSQVSLLQQKR